MVIARRPSLLSFLAITLNLILVVLGHNQNLENPSLFDSEELITPSSPPKLCSRQSTDESSQSKQMEDEILYDIHRYLQKPIVVEEPPLRPKMSSESTELDEKRRQAVKKAFLHAWNNYKTYAWGKDELRPLSRSDQNWLNLGLTILDALDTLIIMDLKEETRQAIEWVSKELDFDRDLEVSFFETTIRVLGGLLSAYELSGEKVLLDKAQDIGTRLLRAFDGSPHGIPLSSVNLKTGYGHSPVWAGYSSMLSEITTVQLEFSVLARHLNDSSIAEKPLQVIKTLDSLPKGATGLYSVYISTSTGSWGPSDRVTLGALGDSFYEYLLKMWLLTGKKERRYKQMYDDTSEAILSYMTVTTSPSALTFLAELDNKNLPPTHILKMDHLACFAGAMYALGAATDDVHERSYRERHHQYGENLTTICHEMYSRSPTGIAPEIISLSHDQDFIPKPGAYHYLLRPETVESFFVLFRLTGDQKYKEWAWQVFEAIEKHCRVEHGYSGIHDVTQVPVTHDDVQQSFFLAETLKYLYLLFSPPSLLPLDQFVFNTEAHPFRIFRDDPINSNASS